MNQAVTSVSWGRRWTFIMAATGSAVGLGNIWKFPYITGEYGGGAFVAVYLLCILLVVTPVMIAEIMLGKKGRTDPVHTMLSISREVDASKAWSIIGIMGVLAGLMILMFYGVVAGWALDYTAQTIIGTYIGQSPTEIASHFAELTADNGRQLMWHSIFIALTAGIIAAGVTRGIGTAVETLMPILFVLLLVLLGYSWSLGDMPAAIKFMFAFDFSKLTHDAILVALGHAFFTVSLGMGAIMVYGAYMPAEASVPKSVLAIVCLDTLVALTAGLAIFPLVFASDLQPGSGPGLMFESLPIVFATMDGGALFGSIFFLLVSVAALSSSISLIEPAVAWLERLGVARVVGTIGFALLCWAGGVACIYSGEVFNALDNITSTIMLPLGGLLIALFVGWKLGYTKARKQVDDISTLWFNVWFILLRFIAPLGVFIVFINSVRPVLKAWLGAE